MTRPTIKPHNCPSIWSVDGTLFLELPHGALSHTISVPATIEGFAKILNMLSVRTPQTKIGFPGDPTQHHIDKPIDFESKVRRVGKQKFTQDQRESAMEVLRKLGMV